MIALALPALGALAAEPLYVLGDTAIVGHLGRVPLAGLAIAGTLLSEVVGLCTFLEYGTTAKAARLYGAGHEREALDVGVQATWLALALGTLCAVALELAAGPALRLIAGSDDGASLHQALTWFRIAAVGCAVHARDRRGAGLAARVPGHAHGVRGARGLEPGERGALAHADPRLRAGHRGIRDRERRLAGRGRGRLRRPAGAPRPVAAPVVDADAAAVARRARPRPALARLHGGLPARGGRRGAHGRRAGRRPHDRLPALDLRGARARLGRDRRAGADRPSARRGRGRCRGRAGAAPAARGARLRDRRRRVFAAGHTSFPRSSARTPRCGSRRACCGRGSSG